MTKFPLTIRQRLVEGRLMSRSSPTLKQRASVVPENKNDVSTGTETRI